MKILVTGRDGQVGWELQRTLLSLGEVVACDQAEMDLACSDSIREYVNEVKPEIIVHAGAYTAVDKAESEAELVMSINALASGIIAEEAKRLNALLIYYSTDYVFDGTKPGCYVEEDIPCPLSVYGATKLAGERAIQSVAPAHMILRTSWIYGARGHNFMLTMLKLAKERDEVRVVDDQIGAPTWCRALAEATARILQVRLSKIGNKADAVSDGIYHLTASGITSWCGFAAEIMDLSKLAYGQSSKVIPVASEEYRTPAKRPMNSVLSGEKLKRVFGFNMETWRNGLRGAFDDFSRVKSAIQ